MLTVETIRKIGLAARDGKGIRQITKDLNSGRFADARIPVDGTLTP